MKVKLLAAAAVLAVTAVPAFAESHNSDVCLMRRDIDGWGAHGKDQVVINDRFGRKYLVTVAGYCVDLDYAFGLGVRSFGGSPDMCVERGDHIVMRGGGASGHDACWVTNVQRYTKEMEQQDRESRRGHSY